MFATHRSNHDSQPRWLFLKKQFQAMRMLKIFTLPATRGISCSGIGDLYSQVEGKNCWQSTWCFNCLLKWSLIYSQEGGQKSRGKEAMKVTSQNCKTVAACCRHLHKASCALAFSSALSCWQLSCIGNWKTSNQIKMMLSVNSKVKQSWCWQWWQDRSSIFFFMILGKITKLQVGQGNIHFHQPNNN